MAKKLPPKTAAAKPAPKPRKPKVDPLLPVKPGNARRNAIPKGIRGFRIQCHVGGIPADPADWVFLNDDRSPYDDIRTPPAPLTIAYRVAWVSDEEVVGPYGDPQVATITP